jgi:hypothetical protein
MGLSTEAGPILRECADRASQGLSGALSSEYGRAVPCGWLWATAARAACRRGLMHEKSPHPVRGRGQGARVAAVGTS